MADFLEEVHIPLLPTQGFKLHGEAATSDQVLGIGGQLDLCPAPLMASMASATGAC